MDYFSYLKTFQVVYVSENIVYNILYIRVCGPRIFNDAFPLDRRDSLFVYLGEKYDFQKRLGVATYFYLFLKGKTSKNKTPKWTPNFFGKAVYEKPESGFGDQVTYWEGTVKTVAPL